MKNTERKTKTIKLRVTESEYEAITIQSQRDSTTISDTIRKTIFNSSNSSSTAILAELSRQKMYNLIQHTSMPKYARESLMKELNRHD